MLMKLKNILLVPLLKFIIRHPGIMESRLFLKAMQVFPAKPENRSATSLIIMA